MKRVTRNRILASVLSLLMALSLVVAVPNFNANVNVVKASEQTLSAQYGLQENAQDGLILHAWNWSYNTIKSNLPDIAKAGYSTIQTSPVQQPKDYNAKWTDWQGQWWKLYQPISYSIANQSWIGTKEDLTSLCKEAKKYGIKIICDIVANHLANTGVKGEDGVMSNQVAAYEPTIYNEQGTYVHQDHYNADDGNGYSLTHGWVCQCPDINTSNYNIQQKVAKLLKDCIDCGVSGFRFDAAKHIETEYDNGFGSDFWKNTVDVAKAYAKSTKNIDLYCYGETLNSPGVGRSYSYYTNRMSITDNQTGNAIRQDIKHGIVAGASSSFYKTQQKPNKLVLWAESHDTYMHDPKYDDNPDSVEDYSADENAVDISKAWAMVASRANATSLYFARPNNDTKMGAVGSTDYKSVLTSSVNHFHNNFVGAQEYLSNAGSIAMNERYFTKGATTSGAVLVNVNGTNSYVQNMKVNCLGDGTYTDQVTGNKFTVSGGKISGNIGSTGIAVVYNVPDNKPANTVNPGSKDFSTETLDIELGLENATSGTYQIGEKDSPKTYTGSKTITIGKDMKVGESVNVYVTATDGKTTTGPEKHTYTKVDPKQTVQVYFSNNRHWDKVNVYYWGGKNPSNAWPGNAMKKAYTNEYGEDVYSFDIPKDVKAIIFNNGNGQQTVDITTPLVNGMDFFITGGPDAAHTVDYVIVK